LDESDASDISDAIDDKPQRHAFARLFLDLHHQLELAMRILWDLELIPFRLLVYKSRFLPRILGLWLIVACFAYLAVSFTGLLFSDYEDRGANITGLLPLAENGLQLVSDDAVCRSEYVGSARL